MITTSRCFSFTVIGELAQLSVLAVLYDDLGRCANPACFLG